MVGYLPGIPQQLSYPENVIVVVFVVDVAENDGDFLFDHHGASDKNINNKE